MTPAQIRARAGHSCECKGECGMLHHHNRCRHGGTGSVNDRRYTLHVAYGKQYCARCLGRVTDRRALEPSPAQA